VSITSSRLTICDVRGWSFVASRTAVMQSQAKATVAGGLNLILLVGALVTFTAAP
jgi:hypothetical protein